MHLFKKHFNFFSLEYINELFGLLNDTEKIKFELASIIEKELAMHKVTFKNPEVREKIELLFGK